MLSGKLRKSGIAHRVDSLCGRGTSRSRPRLSPYFLLLAAWLLSPRVVTADELSDARDHFRRGDYRQAARIASDEIAAGTWRDEWPILKVEADLAQGNYANAVATVEQALAKHPYSLRLRLLAQAAYRHSGRARDADRMLGEMERAAATDPRRFGDPAERVALGKFLLDRGADPRQVLELIYDRLREQYPDRLEAFLATAELALEKNDFAVAADTLETTPESAAEEPHYHYLLAKAFAADEPPRAAAAIEEALRINPHHVESLLLRAEQLIDAEKYQEARQFLDRVLAINSRHPAAWSFKSVIAHLENQQELEREARQQALSTWGESPEVDHLIGRKLSQKYRFAEGATHQRRALEFDPGYRPALRQLSQDLLRLGEEEEGWRLAERIAQEDAYDVVAYNLTTLRDEISKYVVIGDDRLRLRMEAREASLYGARALTVLERAREVLCEKYELRLDQPVFIEIFPHQKDFAVRTFGLPGASGYLGVCFGKVITANSPASQGPSPANWEAVLWHEFCHVVTLQKTANKMPRWLSEGISVYEERQENPTWGQSMTPEYREMILGKELTPVSELSSAFLSPASPAHLQFAYYESSLVVEYLIETYGHEALKQILVDLHDGMTINEALIRHTAPLGRLDQDFADHARALATGWAPGADWSRPDLPPRADSEAISRWLDDHPNHYRALQRLAAQLLAENKYIEVIGVTERMLAICPHDTGGDSAHALAAKAHRALGDREAEADALEAWAASDSDAVEAFSRLMELEAERENWDRVDENANRTLAVNPLIPAPHRYLADAAERLKKPLSAIEARSALLEFDTTDRAEEHFCLAGLLHGLGRTREAKRHCLQALEDAPRYLAAHQLLLQIEDGESVESSSVQSGAWDRTEDARAEASTP